MLIPLLIAHAFAASGTAATPLVQHADDAEAGALYDVTEPGLECTTGVVVAAATAGGDIEVREFYHGKVQNDDVVATDADVAAHLVPGEKVVVYRDAHGAMVVGGS
jgi:hypothetical protein